MFFLKQENRERGLAMIAIVLLVNLVVALVLLALTNSRVGQLVGLAHLRKKTISACAYGDLDLATQWLATLLNNSGALPVAPAGVVIAVPPGANVPDVAPLYNELAYDKDVATLAAIAADGADMTITNANSNCVTTVDIDYLFTTGSGFGTPEDKNKYMPVNGPSGKGKNRCMNSRIYSIFVVSSSINAIGGTSPTTQARSLYNHC